MPRVYERLEHPWVWCHRGVLAQCPWRLRQWFLFSLILKSVVTQACSEHCMDNCQLAQFSVQKVLSLFTF